MSDPRRGLPPPPNALTIDQASMQACMNEIGDTLKKFNCMLIYQQVFQNGLPANPGQFIVVKQPPNNQERPGIIHPEGNA
jgi:hypothetical protein